LFLLDLYREPIAKLLLPLHQRKRTVYEKDKILIFSFLLGLYQSLYYGGYYYGIIQGTTKNRRFNSSNDYFKN
ncbi:hypothetical protein DVP99_21275, partial [Yersinia enterocolitica]|nr:hypothetical protein [Yersinia enterocolitica]